MVRISVVGALIIASAAASATRVSEDEIEQVGGILPVVRFQPISSLVRIDE